MAFEFLSTLTSRSRDRYAPAKHANPPPSQVRAARDAADRKAERLWKLEVWTRDEGKCRYTGKKLKRTMSVDPLRGERHHLAGKADKRVRWDPRNALLLALWVHEKVERNELRIVGTMFFEVDGHRYIDARFPVLFEVVS